MKKVQVEINPGKKDIGSESWKYPMWHFLCSLLIKAGCVTFMELVSDSTQSAFYRETYHKPQCSELLLELHYVA
jgi:hypothetical protein